MPRLLIAKLMPKNSAILVLNLERVLRFRLCVPDKGHLTQMGNSMIDGPSMKEIVRPLKGGVSLASNYPTQL